MKSNLLPSCFNRRAAIIAITGAIADLTGCGGGSGSLDISGLSTGGTGSFTTGTITGFGSIIVNGIRYDDALATIVSDDDSDTRNTSLQIGMVVVIEGSEISPATTPSELPFATAHRITYGSEWTGPVSSIVKTNASNTFEILGNTVDVLTSTVFSGSVSQMSELTTDHYAEVYGYVDQTNGHIQASRIDVTTTQPSAYKLSGAITQVNPESMKATVGQTPVEWNTTLVLPADAANGAYVRAVLNPTPNGPVYTTTRIRILSSPLQTLQQEKEYKAEVNGSITAFMSNTQFTVKGIPVNAANAKVSGLLRSGAQVEVQGIIKSGQLIASQVDVKDVAKVESKDYEFIGYISNITAQTFVLKDITFDYDGNTENKSILNRERISQIKVKVKAKRINSRWLALQIEADD
jgi:hypothetical protein